MPVGFWCGFGVGPVTILEGALALNPLVGSIPASGVKGHLDVCSPSVLEVHMHGGLHMHRRAHSMLTFQKEGKLMKPT